MTAIFSRSAVLWTIVVFDLVFLALPTLIVLVTSITAGDMISFPPQGFSLKWYLALIERDDFHSAFLRSIYVATLCTAIAIPTGTLAAIAMIRYRIRCYTLLQTYFLLPFTVPLVVSGVSMMILFGRLGWLGQIWPVGLALCIINLPFMIWAVSASVNQLDRDLEDAAANCGAPPIQTFFTVTLPAVIPGIVTGALLMFVLAVNEFVVSLFLVDKRIVTLPVEIFLSVRDVVTPDVSAISVVYVIIALTAIWLLDRLVGLEVFLKSR